MAGERVERRLTAILAADVAGYSRLMGADEKGTLAALKAIRRELGDPKIAEHRGRIVKTTGDGILIEFPSVVEAVACAVAVQQGMTSHNAAIPQEGRIEFRVGINSGDVIVEVQNQKVRTPEEVMKRVAADEKTGRKVELMLVSRGGNRTFVAVRLGGQG